MTKFDQTIDVREAVKNLLTRYRIPRCKLARMSGRSPGAMTQILNSHGDLRGDTERSLVIALRDTLFARGIKADDDDLFRQVLGAVVFEAADFQGMEREAERAKEHFILTFRPAETIRTDRARYLMEVMAIRLGLLPSEHPQANIRYKFYLPSRLIARLLWMNLHAFLAEKCGEATAIEALRRVNATEAGVGEARLCIYRVNRLFCTYPTVVYDPTTPEPRGFVMYYHGENVSIAKMSQDALTIWMEEVHAELIVNREKHGVEPITWKGVQGDLDHAKE
jgi:hypothetical protein